MTACATNSQSAVRARNRGNVAKKPAVYHSEKEMRALLKPNLLMSLQQNTAGLIVDLGILAIFLVALAAK